MNVRETDVHDVVDENRRLRRAMRDVVALSTLPAVWMGLGRDRIASSLADVLLNALALEFVYIRLAQQGADEAVEIVKSRQHLDPGQTDAIRKAIAALDVDRLDHPSVSATPFGTVNVALARFGVGDTNGILIACSRNADFPSEQDRLLLGVGANQTAIVLQRLQAEQQMRQQREWLQVTLASIGDAVITTDTAGRVTYLNAVAEALTGWTSADATGQPLERVFNLLDEQTRLPVENPVGNVLRNRAVLGVANHVVLVAKDGTEQPISDSAAPIRDSAGATIGVVMVFRGVGEQRKAEQHRSVRLAVTEILNVAANVPDMIHEVLQALGHGLGWDAALFWALDDESARLECRASWHLQDKPVGQFLTDSRNHRFGHGEGLPGRVWASVQPCWIADVSTDDDFVRARAAAAAGVRSAFACPVIVGNRTRGVLEFVATRRREADSALLETMGSVAGSVGQFIQRKAAEDDVRRSEAELAEFFENATVGLHWVGPDGTILRANRAELEMMGYSREEYVGQPISAFHADEEAIGEILAKLMAGERLVEHPARLRCKDGTIKDVLIDSSALWNGNEFVHTRCFTRDVTERKRAELALAEARSQLDAALEAGAIATWTWDIPLNRLFADEQLARLFNLPPSAANGGSPDDYKRAIRTEDLPVVTAALERSLQTGEDYQADYRIVQSDGSLRWVTARGRPEYDSAGRPVRMAGVLVDISERKALEDDLRLRLDELAAADRAKEELVASLRESEEKLRLLADTIPQLAWTARRDGFIFWYNRRWYEYTGTTESDMEGWGWQSVHDPQRLPEVLERWKACIASGEPFEMVFPLRGADGEFRPFLTRVNPLRDADGRILYWFGTNTDISEIKRMEEALRDADRRKDEFLATLAHELRNPLAPIRNSLQILNMPRVDADTLRQATEMMERQVNALVRLVDDLLDVARVMRGKIVLRKEPVELATVIARAVETVQTLIEAHGHQLQLSIPDQSLLVHADPVRLVQVVSNLLTNSAKYSEANGHIRVSVSRHANEAVLKVADDGIGIAPNVLPHVFDLFVQADDSFTRAQGGLGIGLTLVRNLAEMHGGSVEAHSDGPGRGAEFIVRLPLIANVRDDVKEAVAVATRNKQHPGHRLLVVDDNEDAAVSLAMLLRLQGHDVRVAHDGPSALAVASSFRPRMVLLDLGMRDMDGYEVARRLRRQPGLERVVLTALTGWGQDEDRRRTAAAGFDHHLVKPPEPRRLQRLLDAL